MWQGLFSRSRTLKLILIAVIFLLLTVILFINDSLVAKIHAHHIPASCILCPYNENISFRNSSAVINFNVYPSKKSHRNPVNIVSFFSNVNRNPNLKSKFIICLSSLFKFATPPLHLHILTDDRSLSTTVEILQKTIPHINTSVEISLYDVNTLLEPLKDLIDFVRPYFSFKQGAYYSDGLFYISIALFKVMSLKKVIIIDADVKFLSDIKDLNIYFDKFTPDAIIGIAKEQQPVYRHVLYEYRKLNENTRIGGPPPDGVPGFNSGVLLLDLEKMRQSELYNNILNNSTVIVNLIKKYRFKGHLGDQDFYTLINFEYPNLFYTLPCTWNRQLCQWWKRHGYKEVFDLYHSCNGTINLLHGNCNSLIPDDLDIYTL